MSDYESERDAAAETHCPNFSGADVTPFFRAGADWALTSSVVKGLYEELQSAQSREHARACLDFPNEPSSHSFNCMDYKEALKATDERLSPWLENS